MARSFPPQQDGFRVCRLCGQNKHISEYGIKNSMSTGRMSSCRRCENERVAARKASDESYAARRRDAEHRSATKRLHGITNEEYDRLHEDPKCSGCSAARSPEGRRLSVDHCHATGKVRGLLCSHCNLVLGKVGDNPDILRNLASYLEAGGSRTL